MRKTKLSIISMLALVAVMGVAWASFIFSDTATDTNNDIGITINGYADAGTVSITDLSTSTFALDETMPSITFKIKHTVDVGGGGDISDLGTPTYTLTAAIKDDTLNSYIVFGGLTGTWTDTTETTITMTIDWANDMKPESVAEWTALNTALTNASGDAIVEITATVTYA